jgi:hypothetical protein
MAPQRPPASTAAAAPRVRTRARLLPPPTARRPPAALRPALRQQLPRALPRQARPLLLRLLPPPPPPPPLLLPLLLLLLHQPTPASAYRLFNESDYSDPYFVPHASGFVGAYGDPLRTLERERVNEGVAGTAASSPPQQPGARPRQNCPGMVGPLGDGKFFCLGREHGQCDRRSGTCLCNRGYAGVDCGDCVPTHHRIGRRCYQKRPCPRDCSGAGVCDHTKGTCTCNGYRSGAACDGWACGARFDARCLECTAAECTRCAQGWAPTHALARHERAEFPGGHAAAAAAAAKVATNVPSAADPHAGVNAGTAAGAAAAAAPPLSRSTCAPCTRFDPRCSACDSRGCLRCADPLLRSIRRSGARAMDGVHGGAALASGAAPAPAVLPEDELRRTLSLELPFGTQRADAFDEAEPFELQRALAASLGAAVAAAAAAAAGTGPAAPAAVVGEGGLRAAAQHCEQGADTPQTAAWACTTLAAATVPAARGVALRARFGVSHVVRLRPPARFGMTVYFFPPRSSTYFSLLLLLLLLLLL